MSPAEPLWFWRAVVVLPIPGGIVRRSLWVLLVAILATLPQVTWAQTRQVTGTVTIAGSSVPLHGAIVSVEGSTTAVHTGPDGTFRLNAPAGQFTIMARYIGYKRSTR